MQRAAATAAAKETSESPFADDTGSHTPKRPRLSTEPESDSPSKSRAELEAISAAVTAEEEKRREAIARQAAEAGETEWVLDYSTFGQFAPQPNVIEADSLDADDDEITGGRKSYGNFKRKKTGVCPPCFCLVMLTSSRIRKQTCLIQMRSTPWFRRKSRNRSSLI